MAVGVGKTSGVRTRLFDVEEYHRMGEIGVLSEDDHVELIEGRLFYSRTGGERLFDVHEYHRMIEAGIIREGDRVELIGGRVLEMAAMGSRHAACVAKLTTLLVERLGRTVVVRAQNPVRLFGGAEPEPDIALAKPREDFYVGAHPTPGDVLLVIEVSDTTLRYDNNVKLPLYADAGIAEAWIVDLNAEIVEIHTRPADGLFRDTTRTKRGETLRSQTLPNLELAATDVLGPGSET